MRLPLYDAHAHLPKAGVHGNSRETGLQNCVVNGTSPADWLKVLELGRQDIRILPAIGLHPQWVDTTSGNWQVTFLKLLDEHSGCAIGEIGLDRRSQMPNHEEQLDAFLWQLEQAHLRNLPTSIHCVKAIGLLMSTLRTQVLPDRGIHLHAYNGPVELIPELYELGAYFSFSAQQLNSGNPKVVRRIRKVPVERLLIETDLAFSNDFSELERCYFMLAQIYEQSPEAFTQTIEDNFTHYFLRANS